MALFALRPRKRRTTSQLRKRENNPLAVIRRLSGVSADTACGGIRPTGPETPDSSPDIFRRLSRSRELDKTQRRMMEGAGKSIPQGQDRTALPSIF